MSESYPKSPENRGIPRPFADFDEADFRRAFNVAIGVKNEPSKEEARFLEKARRYCRFLAKLPGIRRVWVCNSLSMNTGDADSDIDLFIETAPGMLWTGRIFATLYFSLLAARRHGNKVVGRFCLSFFAVEGADFSSIAIKDDAYLYEWARRLILVGGDSDPRSGRWRPQTIRRPGSTVRPSVFLGEVPLVRTILPNEDVCSDDPNGDPTSTETQANPPLLVRSFEALCKALFLDRTLREYERLGRPWGIVISDEFLKFTQNDRRIEIREDVRWELEKDKENPAR